MNSCCSIPAAANVMAFSCGMHGMDLSASASCTLCTVRRFSHGLCGMDMPDIGCVRTAGLDSRAVSSGKVFVSSIQHAGSHPGVRREAAAWPAAVLALAASHSRNLDRCTPPPPLPPPPPPPPPPSWRTPGASSTYTHISGTLLSYVTV